MAVLRPHELDGLVAGPAEQVHAGVDHEPAGAQRVERQHPEPGDVGGVQAHLVGEPLAVEPPALDVAADLGVEEAPVGRQAGQPLRAGDLQVVAGDALVEGQRLVLVGEALLRVGGEHAVRPGREPSTAGGR